MAVPAAALGRTYREAAAAPVPILADRWAAAAHKAGHLAAADRIRVAPRRVGPPVVAAARSRAVPIEEQAVAVAAADHSQVDPIRADR